VKRPRKRGKRKRRLSQCSIEATKKLSDQSTPGTYFRIHQDKELPAKKRRQKVESFGFSV